MTVASETCSHAATAWTSLGSVSASGATRSSSETGAELWETPTTRTLIRFSRGPRGSARPRLAAPTPCSSVGWSRHDLRLLALLVVGEDLQLDREVDLAHVDAVGHRDHGRREVEDAADSGLDHPVGDVLGGAGRGGDDADGHAVLAHDRAEVGEVADVDAGDLLTAPGRVGVEQRDQPEAAAAEAGEVGQRVAEVPA